MDKKIFLISSLLILIVLTITIIAEDSLDAGYSDIPGGISIVPANDPTLTEEDIITVTNLFDINSEEIQKLNYFGWQCSFGVCCSYSDFSTCFLNDIPDGSYASLNELGNLLTSEQQINEQPEPTFSGFDTGVGLENVCKTKECQEIDEVWLKIKPFLRLSLEKSGEIVWDPIEKWITYKDIYEPDPIQQVITGEGVRVTDISVPEGVAATLVKIYHNYETEINSAASNYNNIPISLIVAVIKQESNGNPNAKSSTGAGGLMQLMPATANSLGVTDIYNPQDNINGGTKYINSLLVKHHNNIERALANYNGGDAAVAESNDCPGKLKYQCEWDNPEHTVRNKGFKETRNYVKRVLSYKSIIENNNLLIYYPINKIENVKCFAKECILKKNTRDGLILAGLEAKKRGYTLLVTSAYRTIEKQTSLHKKYNGKGVCGPPNTEFENCPHVKGITVDLTLVKDGNMLSRDEIGCMGAGCSVMIPQFNTYPAQKELYDIMVTAGFGNIRTEWWHFEYGRTPKFPN